ncbi:lactate utilization protein B [Methanobacterium movens]
MKENELKTMRSSFKLMEERRIELMQDPRINKLQERVKNIRKESVKKIPAMVETARENFKNNGMEFLYAEDSHQALDLIYDLIKNEKIVAKSKSNTLNELGLSDYLKKKKIHLVETDLGDRIIQLKVDDNKPSHPIGPALHLKVDKIAEIISESLKVKVKADPRAIMELVRSNVLEELKSCKIGITGANSVAAEDGSLIMVHNEGNISLLSLMDTHIVVVGVDKLVETIEDAISVVKLETAYATGTALPSYINVISGPSKTADIEKKLLEDMYGARKVVVIMLDNGRQEALEECLWCIGCGSCIVSCPVYNVLGNEFGYRGYLGGRGVAMSRFLQDEETSISSGLYMCTLCGLCTLECPVNTPTNEIMEKIRKESKNTGFSPKEHLKIFKSIKKKGSPF